MMVTILESTSKIDRKECLAKLRLKRQQVNHGNTVQMQDVHCRAYSALIPLAQFKDVFLFFCQIEHLGRFGGGAGIRTLDASFSSHTPLAGEPLQPLGHASKPSAHSSMRQA